MCTKSIVTAAGLVLAFAAPALAGPKFQWTWNRGNAGSYSLNDDAGKFESVFAEYDAGTGKLKWLVTFEDQKAQGFTLALNNGPDPKGHAGELALLYFDARDVFDADPTTAIDISVFNYNGFNAQNSHVDGSPSSGTQAPDKIEASRADAGFVISVTASNTPGGGRVLGFEIDATGINTHAPAYPGVGGWYGMKFDDHLGLWMHPYRNLSASYGLDGYLNAWSGAQGWFDGSNFRTVPAPASAGVLAVGLAGLTRRRRA